ncbi:TetR/AcrR family transcriptional regulator [Microbacterium sp. SORGH_AS_0888]|uniref:TetR/AcrR family transcriptional regulator n=1 Tax=Microbacterium sp. SORGH_AS_0888 TaxID=3041791 RepID=UPI00277EC1BC|nr:TetR/AcrR family transcriptional regulator [Microbacterium sp. SORGH_AS_0888]MDQ1129955.1 AcrR family transcriptional regulator [Microbacterium sp. SORGH_AS_0888]
MTTLATRPRRDAAANREALLEAARRVVVRDPHASMDTIAREAGLSRRAMYGHFPDRDTLMRELIRSGVERFNVLAAEGTDDDVSAPLAIARLAVRLWGEAAQVQVNAALALDDAHVAETAAALAPLRARVLQIVTAGQRDQTLRTDMSAVQLARLIEETARTAITRLDASAPGSRLAAVKAGLSIAGLSWRESVALIAAHPELEES